MSIWWKVNLKNTVKWYKGCPESTVKRFTVLPEHTPLNFKNTVKWYKGCPESTVKGFTVLPEHTPLNLKNTVKWYKGCPKIISFDKSNWHPVFEKSLQSSFFLPLYTRTFSQHPLPKNALPFSIKDMRCVGLYRNKFKSLNEQKHFWFYLQLYILYSFILNLISLGFHQGYKILCPYFNKFKGLKVVEILKCITVRCTFLTTSV